jgi:hypothetical protein
MTYAPWTALATGSGLREGQQNMTQADSLYGLGMSLDSLPPPAWPGASSDIPPSRHALPETVAQVNVPAETMPGLFEGPVDGFPNRHRPVSPVVDIWATACGSYAYEFHPVFTVIEKCPPCPECYPTP